MPAHEAVNIRHALLLDSDEYHLVDLRRRHPRSYLAEEEGQCREFLSAWQLVAAIGW